MICRRLRDVSGWKLNLALGLCLIASGVVAAVPSLVVWGQEQAASLTTRAPEYPPAAVEKTTGVRLQKQGPSGRFTLPKPARGMQLSSAETHYVRPGQPRIHQTSRDLPRRLLPAQRYTLRSSDDTTDPLLS